MIFLETSFIVGLTVETDNWHQRASELFLKMGNKITSQMVVYEVLTVLRKKKQDDKKLRIVYNSLLNSKDITVLNDVIYYDKALEYTFNNPIGFFDNLSYIVMINNNIKEIASFDPDFDIFQDIKRIE